MKQRTQTMSYYIKDKILKNVNKFTSIKLAKGVILDDVKLLYDNTLNNQGLSTGEYYCRKFKVNNQYAIFKSFNDTFLPQLRNVRIVNELICNELADQIKFDCVKYSLATYKNIQGLISYLIDLKPDEKIISGNFLSGFMEKINISNFENFYIGLKILERYHYKFDENDMLTYYYKLMLFDTLTLQTDRHLDNVNFIYDMIKRTVRPCPLLDNEFAFLGRTLQNIIDDTERYKDHKVTSFDLTFYLKPTQEKNPFKDIFQENIKDIVKIAEIFINFVNNMNIDKAIKKLQDQNIEIDNSYIDFMKDIVADMKKELMEIYLTKEDNIDFEK